MAGELLALFWVLVAAIGSASAWAFLAGMRGR